MLEYFWLSEAMKASNEAAEASASAQYAAHQAQTDSERLLKRVASLELAVETLLRMALAKGAFTEAEFCHLAQLVDLEDGVLDGRRDLSKMRKVCPKCRKANPADRGREVCMWCDESLATVKATAPEARTR